MIFGRFFIHFFRDPGNVQLILNHVAHPGIGLSRKCIQPNATLLSLIQIVCKIAIGIKRFFRIRSPLQDLHSLHVEMPHEIAEFLVRGRTRDALIFVHCELKIFRYFRVSDHLKTMRKIFERLFISGIINISSLVI